LFIKPETKENMNLHKKLYAVKFRVIKHVGGHWTVSSGAEKMYK